MRKAFDSDDYQVMIVANKFQTGFDQPKLCAMLGDFPKAIDDAILSSSAAHQNQMIQRPS